MMIHKLKNYTTAIKQFGLKAVFEQLYFRFKKRLFILKNKNRRISKPGYTNWQSVSKKYNLPINFNDFFYGLDIKKLLHNIFESQDFQDSLPDEFHNLGLIKQKADLFANNCFELLGSKLFCFDDKKVDWQVDFKFRSVRTKSYASIKFYSDIKIDFPQNPLFDDYNFDIKVPWELSRMQHFFILGLAYKNFDDEKFAQAFKNQVEDWIENNPYLFGVNWVCPMDVAIRSLNLIWGFYFFVNSKTISIDFWEKFVCLLDDHAVYLENNFEKTFKPHNHYLSNLIGYLYLCLFFSSIKKFRKSQKWVCREILKEWKRQINNDGSAYEGSTAYHRLVCEIFFHFSIISTFSKFTLPQSFSLSLTKMIKFIEDCTDNKDNFVKIGDDDSGKILCGINTRKLSSTQNFQNNFFNYTDFGISIIKTLNWHITFRQPIFFKNQPTGHFHKDFGSITLNINGIPILVDPGSYLYTANASWRNLMRNSESHNRFFIQELEKISNQLFELDLESTDQQESIILNQNKISITSLVENYKNIELKLKRSIIFDKHDESITIYDWQETLIKQKPYNLIWNFIFHPNISLEQKNNYCWFIKYKSETIAILNSNLEFTQHQGYFAPCYGKIENCIRIKAEKNILDVNAISPLITKIKKFKP